MATQRFGDLNRKCACTARSAIDEHSIASFDIRRKRLVRDKTTNTQCRCLFDIDAIWKRNRACLRSDDVFAQCANRLARLDFTIHHLPDFEMAVRACFDYFSGKVKAGRGWFGKSHTANDREFWELVVDGVEGGDVDLNQGLSGCELARCYGQRRGCVQLDCVLEGVFAFRPLPRLHCRWEVGHSGGCFGCC
jgi:hypothetical protein